MSHRQSTRFVRGVPGRAGVALAILAMGSGCTLFQQGRQPPLKVPPFEVRGRHFVGSPFAGSAPTSMPAHAARVPPDEALAVRVEAFAYEAMPAGGGPIGAGARLVTTDGGARPLLAAPRLLAGARLFDGAGGWPKGRSVPLAEWRGALPEGVTAAFDVAGPGEASEPSDADALRRSIAIQVHRPAGKGSGAVEVAVFCTDRAEENRAAQHDAVAPVNLDVRQRRVRGARATSLQREGVVIAAPAPSAASTDITVAIPFRLGPAVGGTRAIVLRLDVAKPDGSPGHSAACASCSEDLAEAARAAVATAPGESDDAAWSGLDGALATFVEDSTRRRAALIYLESSTAAHVCGDLALVGNDSYLGQYAGEVKKRLDTTAAVARGADLGWLLDRVCLELLSDALAAGKLPPELASVVTRVGGEVGRHPDAFGEIARAATNWQDLQSRLATENTIYLEDSAPAARVRAYDWLRANGGAPPGYDPLADRRQRRAAIERAAASAAASQPATQASAGGGS